MALIQLELGVSDSPDLNTKQVQYDKQSKVVYALMMDKNHDYGEAWRTWVSSLTDLILQKLMRIKKEGNDGKTTVSEGTMPIIKTLSTMLYLRLIQLRGFEE